MLVFVGVIAIKGDSFHGYTCTRAKNRITQLRNGSTKKE